MSPRPLVALAALAALGCQPMRLEDVPCEPSSTALTYESFGRPFFEAHCNQCHGGRASVTSRAFLTAESIRGDRERIFLNAAGDNAAMPPGPDGPSRADRDALAEWLACGAP